MAPPPRPPPRPGTLALILSAAPLAGLHAAPGAEAAASGPIPLSKPAAGSPAAAATGNPTPAMPPASARPHAAPAAHAPVKAAPKPGPGANDAGQHATSLRTIKLTLASLIDRSVVGREKHMIGHVIDVLIDPKGQPAALVVDVGGFMGMGNRRIAIAWERFALAGEKAGDALQIPFSEAEVKAAPAFNGAREVTVVQDATEPTASRASLASSRVNLGEDLGPLTNTAAPQADPLNPD